jgi:hypothetical protein
MSTRNIQPDNDAPINRDALLEAFAAELTLAAYRVALRTNTQSTWLDLQLELWKALADTVKTWGGGTASVPLAGDAACRSSQGNSHDHHARSQNGSIELRKQVVDLYC